MCICICICVTSNFLCQPENRTRSCLHVALIKLAGCAIMLQAVSQPKGNWGQISGKVLKLLKAPKAMGPAWRTSVTSTCRNPFLLVCCCFIVSLRTAHGLYRRRELLAANPEEQLGPTRSCLLVSCHSRCPVTNAAHKLPDAKGGAVSVLCG